MLPHRSQDHHGLDTVKTRDPDVLLQQTPGCARHEERADRIRGRGLTATILTQLGAPKLRARHGVAVRVRFEAEFSFGAVALQYEWLHAGACTS